MTPGPFPDFRMGPGDEAIYVALNSKFHEHLGVWFKHVEKLAWSPDMGSYCSIYHGI